MANKPTKALSEQKFNDDWQARIIEVIDKYEPDLVYFYNKMDLIKEENQLDFLSYYYNQEKNSQKVGKHAFLFKIILEK